MRLYRKQYLDEDHHPGVDPVPYYGEGRFGIKCLKCGAEFVGVHVCLVK